VTSGALNGKFSGKMSLNLNVPFLYGLSDAALIEHIQLWMLASSGSIVMLGRGLEVRSLNSFWIRLRSWWEDESCWPRDD